MTLSPGVQLGPYEILSPLGAGGMGEVYRARDPRLGRDVAIKVLAPGLAQDKDALARFEREAKTASALNHPHIVQIYEIGQAETPSGLARYIAMELVDGETLRARLRSGARWGNLIEPLAQAADALARAHKAGIVHRDLKPENVMITPDGYPKLVDFGLAKLTELAPGPEDDPTRSLAGRTRTGTLLGTPGYMSPEQAQGKPLDPRSDVFSFGCILYEVATGRQPFRGDSSVVTLHAIVYEEPAPIASLNPEAPAALRGIVGKCLEKEPARRYQGMKDVADDLRTLARGELGAGALPTTTSARLLAAVRTPTRRWLLPAGVLALVVIAVLVGWRGSRKDGRAEGPRPRSTIQVEKLTNRGNARNPQISPDGRYLAYTSSEVPATIWLRDIAEKTETRLVARLETDDWGVEHLWFASDDRSIYYGFTARTGEQKLYRIALIGGEPRPVRTDRPDPRWSPDNRHLAFFRVREGKRILFIAQAEGDQEWEIGEAGLGGPMDWVGPLVWSEDSSRLLFSREVEGKYLLFVVQADGTAKRKIGELAQKLVGANWKPDGTGVVCGLRRDDGREQFVEVSLDLGATRPVGNTTWAGIKRVLWLPDASGFLALGASLEEPSAIWLVSYPEGKAERIPAGAQEYASLSLTADGKKLVALQSTQRSEILVSSDPEKGPFEKVAAGTDVLYDLCWTVDGKIVYASNDAGSYDLYVSDPDGENRRQLTFDRTGNESAPVATPDGRYIVFSSDRTGRHALYRISPDGTGLASLTSPTTERGDSEPQVTPDGQWVFFRRWDDGPTLWKVPIEGGMPTLVKGARPAALLEIAYGASVSPDGRSLAFFYFNRETASGKWSMPELVIGSLDGRIRKRFPMEQVAVGDVQRVQWSRDGRSLYYQIRRDSVNLWKQSVAGGPPVRVTRFEERLHDFDWSFDGKRLACSRGSPVSDVVQITGFR